MFVLIHRYSCWIQSVTQRHLSTILSWVIVSYYLSIFYYGFAIVLYNVIMPVAWVHIHAGCSFHINYVAYLLYCY